MNSERRGITSLLVAFLLCVSPGTVLSGTDEDQVAREMVDAAAEAAAKELGFQTTAKLIDMGLQSTPIVGDEASIGQTTVAWIKLGISLNDFFTADTDKGKFYAGADSAVASLMIANPAAGAVAAIAVLATKLIDSAVSGRHAETMLEIATRTAEHYREILSIYGQLAESDYKKINSTFQFIETQHELLNNLQEELKSDCSTSSLKNADAELLFGCLNLALQVFPKVENLRTATDSLMTFESQFFDIDQYLVQFGIDGVQFRMEMSESRNQQQHSVTAAQNLASSLSEAIAAATIQAAISRGNVNPLRELRYRCFRSASHLNRISNLTLVRWATAPTSELRSELSVLLLEYETSFDGSCKLISLPAPDPLREQMIIWHETRSALTRAIYGERE